MEKKVCKKCKRVANENEMGIWNRSHCYSCDMQEYKRQCQILQNNGMR